MLAAPAQYLIHALLTLQGNYNLFLKVDLSLKEYHHLTCKVDLTREGYYFAAVWILSTGCPSRAEEAMSHYMSGSTFEAHLSCP